MNKHEARYGAYRDVTNDWPPTTPEQVRRALEQVWMAPVRDAAKLERSEAQDCLIAVMSVGTRLYLTLGGRKGGEGYAFNLEEVDALLVEVGKRRDAIAAATDAYEQSGTPIWEAFWAARSREARP